MWGTHGKLCFFLHLDFLIWGRAGGHGHGDQGPRVPERHFSLSKKRGSLIQKIRNEKVHACLTHARKQNKKPWRHRDSRLVSLLHSERWAESTLRQHLLRPSQCFLLTKRSDSPCPLQFLVGCSLHRESLWAHPEDLGGANGQLMGVKKATKNHKNRIQI